LTNPKNSFRERKYEIIEKYFISQSYFPILLIVASSFIVRLIYFPHDFPFVFDNLEYFLYAFDTSVQGKLPIEYSPANNGWPAFMAIIFSAFKFDDPILYMNLQRMVSTIISTMTIIPVFLLSRKFFSRTFSLVGASIFAFEPRLIENSLTGVTEPLYIFLIAITLVLFLSRNSKIVYISFVTAAFASIVRSEGVIIFFIISIMFFVKNRKSIKVIPKYIPALLIFILILLPMMNYKEEIHGDDRIFGRFGEAISDKKNVGLFEQENFKERIFTGITNFSKFFVWDMIPIFIIFVPVGFFLIFRDLNFNKITLLISIIGMAIPAFYAYSLSSLDTRYLFALYPMLSIISIFAIKKYVQKIDRKKIFCVLIIIGIFIVSNIFLDNSKIDYKHQKEAFVIAQYVTENTDGINFYSPESQFIKVAEVIKNWPKMLPTEISGHEIIMPRFSTNGYDSMKDFIENSKNDGLTHLVIDNNSDRPDFFKSVFKNEDVSYLIKQYDSKEDSNLDYHVKIFRIDYEDFENNK